jgi:hypothetical protein
MSISGSKKQQTENYEKKVGLFVANVIAINPTIEEYKDVLGIELKEDSKMTEYLGESKDGNDTVRVDFWIEDVKTKMKFKVGFYLEDKKKENRDGTKTQFINTVGTTSWGVDKDSLPSWFLERESRVAKVGEEDFYNFVRNWLGGLDYRDKDTTLQIEWKKLIRGNVKDLKEQIGGEFCTLFVALAIVKSVEKDGELKTYQGVYNKAFLPEYAMKQIRLIKWDDQTIKRLATKKSKDLKPYERFVIDLKGEYGCKDYYTLDDMRDYNPDDNLVESNKVILEDDGDY